MKSKVCYFFLCLAMLLTSFQATVAMADDTYESEEYEWTRATLGGGGFTLGFIIHPKEPGLIYARTDVGGAFRWDKDNHKWISLMGTMGIDERNYFGIDGMAIDPQNPDILYVAAGKDFNNNVSDVLKSTDRGNTWTATGLNKHFFGNGKYRFTGELIGVDPNNSNIVYVGTRSEGLYRSMDAGTTWSQVPGVPVGDKQASYPGLPDHTDPLGIRCVAFDKTSEKDGASQTIYVSVFGTGIFQTTNGGASWNLIEGSPLLAARMETDSKGVLYVTSLGEGVRRFENGKWIDITPPDIDYRFCGLSIDPNDENNILVSRWAYDNNPIDLPIYRSKDRGNNWEEVSYTAAENRKIAPPWHPEWFFMACTSQVAFDPHHPGQVYVSDWYSVWRTPDIWKDPADSTEWYAEAKGLENTCTLSLSTPRTGAQLISGGADMGGIRHTDLDEYPDGKLLELMGEVNSIDYCEANPNYIAVTGSKHWDKDGVFAISTDNGANFTSITRPGDARNGRLAYSATDPNLIVWTPQNGAPIRTTDMGKTWEETTGGPSVSIKAFWETTQTLASDRVNGNKFYICANKGAKTDSEFYRSEDGGKTWTMVNNTDIAKCTAWDNTQVKTAPGIEGEVWVAMDIEGVYRSSDSGNTFTKVENVQRARLIAFGKPAPGSSVPSVYVLGTVHNVKDGIFRSDDLGKTWIRINDASSVVGNSPNSMEADKQVFGQVFIGTNGSGIIRGYPKNTAQPSEISVIVDGQNVEFPDQKPSIVNDRTLVPVRGVFEKIGATVDWDDATKTVTAKKDDITIFIGIGDNTAAKNGEEVSLDVPPQLIGGRTMVPLRFISEALGCKVEWFGATRSINIITD